MLIATTPQKVRGHRETIYTPTAAAAASLRCGRFHQHFKYPQLTGQSDEFENNFHTQTTAVVIVGFGSIRGRKCSILAPVPSTSSHRVVRQPETRIRHYAVPVEEERDERRESNSTVFVTNQPLFNSSSDHSVEYLQYI